MSPRLKPLRLPQLVEERRKMDSTNAIATQQQQQHTPVAVTVAGPDFELPSTYFAGNSSSSDVTSPVTPTFSTRGHRRCSSSTSSLDLAPQLQDTPSSPIQSASSKPSKRQLPDVQEEPIDIERDNDETLQPDQFGLYSCLCDEPCEHRASSDSFTTGIIGDYDHIDYDMGFLSDSDYPSDSRQPKLKRSATDSPFLALTSRFGSRFNTINRWRSNRKPNLMASPTELSLENVMSREPSSRSSSMSIPPHHRDRSNDLSVPVTPAMSHFDSTDSIDMASSFEFDDNERTSLERERALATTPLLPPLLMSALNRPPPQSPLQSPTVAPTSAARETASPPPMSPYYPRPSLSTKPSVSSFRHGANNSMELPLPLPAMLQEHDEWSDRLGHANFTITPLPYELDTINSETVGKFRDDWDAARVNYTKHLVRTGENYGQTSKIYNLTEAKWAETEKRWRDVYEGAIRQTMSARQSATMSASTSRSRSRGRARGRSGSASAGLMRRPANDDIFAGLEWRRLEGNVPSAVPRMLEALDAQGKFPGLGDEDIVGPMQRAEFMARAQSEERTGAKFWKSLVGKVGFRV